MNSGGTGEGRKRGKHGVYLSLQAESLFTCITKPTLSVQISRTINYLINATYQQPNKDRIFMDVLRLVISEGHYHAIDRLHLGGFNFNQTFVSTGSHHSLVYAVDRMRHSRMSGLIQKPRKAVKEIGAFDIALRYFHEAEGSRRTDCLAMIAKIAQYMWSVIAIRKLTEFILVNGAIIEPKAIDIICKSIAESSQQPVLACVEISAFLTKLANNASTDRPDLAKLAQEYTDRATLLLGDVESDHIVALLLEQQDQLGRSPLGLAIEHQNMAFLANKKVQRVLNAMWTHPSYMTDQYFPTTGAGLLSFGKFLFFAPQQFLRSASGKYAVNFVCFLGFVGLFSYLVWNRPNLTARVEIYEVVLWYCVLALMVDELLELLRRGLADYFADGWNKLDFVMYSSFTVGIALRILRPHALWEYSICVSATSVLLWCRVSALLILHPYLGPFIVMIGKMQNDVFNFLIIGSLLLVAFAMGFYFFLNGSTVISNSVSSIQTEVLAKLRLNRLSGGSTSNATIEVQPVQEFENIGSALLFLFFVILGNFDFSMFQGQSTLIQGFGYPYWILFVLLSIYILLNIFIAMLAGTYSRVSEQASQEYMYGLAETIWTRDRADALLPPPLNVPVLLCYAVFWMVEQVFLCSGLHRRWLKFGFKRAKMQQKKALATVVPLPTGPSVRAGIARGARSPTAAGLLSPKSRNGVDNADLAHLDPDTSASIKRQLETAQALQEEVLQYQEDLGSWCCRHCHAMNDIYNQATFPDYWKYGTEKGLGLTDKDKVRETLQLCRVCYRVRCPVGPHSLRLELISGFFFLWTLWLPLLVIMLIPVLMSGMASCVLSLARRRARTELESQIKQAQRRRKELNPGRVRWVTSHLAKTEHTVEDIWKLVCDRLPEGGEDDPCKDKEQTYGAGQPLGKGSPKGDAKLRSRGPAPPVPVEPTPEPGSPVNPFGPLSPVVTMKFRRPQ